MVEEIKEMTDEIKKWLTKSQNDRVAIAKWLSYCSAWRKSQK
jgi:hypothetical protein